METVKESNEHARGKKHDRKVRGFPLRVINTTRQNCRKYQTNKREKIMCVFVGATVLQK